MIFQFQVELTPVLDDDDEDEDHLVIDEGLDQSTENMEDLPEEASPAVAQEPKEEEPSPALAAAPRGGKRGRGRGRGRGRKSAGRSASSSRDNKSIQDDSVSSSTTQKEEDLAEEDSMAAEEDSNAKAGAKRKAPEEQEETEEEEEPPAKRRMTRNSRMRPSAAAKKKAAEPKGPKTKTWNRDSASSRFNTEATTEIERLTMRTPTPESGERRAVVKREPKDVDQKVFFGSGEEVVLERQLKMKDASSFKKSDFLSSRLVPGGISSLMNKLKASEKEEVSAKPDSDGKKAKEDEKQVPETVEEEKEKNEEEFVVSESAAAYTSKIGNLVSKLKEDVGFVADDSLDLKLSSKVNVNLLGLLRDWSHKPVKQEEAQGEEDKPNLQLDIYTRHKLAKNPSAPVSIKDPSALASQLSPDQIGLLFKCYDRDCAFASNDGAAFVSHLREDHNCRAPATESKRCLCCVYCNQVYRTPAELAAHVVAIHGSCRYQCPHCYHRAGSQVALLVHQQALHPASASTDHGFVRCRSVASSSDDGRLLPPGKVSAMSQISEEIVLLKNFTFRGKNCWLIEIICFLRFPLSAAAPPPPAASLARPHLSCPPTSAPATPTPPSPSTPRSSAGTAEAPLSGCPSWSCTPSSCTQGTRSCAGSGTSTSSR